MTKAEKRAKRDRYLRRKYGKSLDWYERTFQEQGGHCYCCDFTPEKKGLPLHVEHDHKLAKLHVYIKRDGDRYVAFTKVYKKRKWGKTKRKAKQLMKRWLLRKSVRGLVCWPCNSLIRKSYDEPDRLFKAAEMLDKHQKKMKWRKYASRTE